ncbi:MAG: hypothetical protein R3321_10055 [Nitrososphaeraceae archaeon]|nr:hypothetical protein [Nitrososphaeraceae archaeon]
MDKKRYKQELEELKMKVGFGRITKEEYEKELKELENKYEKNNRDKSKNNKNS